MKGIHTALIWLFMILNSFIIMSCKEQTKFPWQPGISAPKNYPVAGYISFGNAGFGSGSAFDSGWGDEYGGVVSGERYKEIPDEVYIEYFSVVDRLEYAGVVVLPQEKIIDIFKEYNIYNFDDNSATLVVGMAPGGWIRVWFTTIDYNASKIVRIEVAKAQLKGHKNESVGIALKTKNFETWGNRYIYWQHFGIPYEAWAENEKEYDIVFDFTKNNPDYQVFDVLYSSIDGTMYQNTINDKLMNDRKLPADIVVGWESKKKPVYYNTHILMPKNFSKIIESRNSQKVVISLEIEKNEQYGILYITTNNKKEKLLRFQNYPAKYDINGNSEFSKNTEYFIQ